MGGGAGGDGVADDVTGECTAGDADSVGAVVVVVWMIVHRGWWWSLSECLLFFRLTPSNVLMDPPVVQAIR